MRLGLMVVEDFLPLEEWQGWRLMAQEVAYNTYAHDDGQIYKNIGLVPDGFSLRFFIAHALGGKPVQEHLQYFRKGEPGDGAGNIHIDDGEGQWATVLYLNDAEELRQNPSGTAFWRHKWIGDDVLPADPEPELIALVNEDRVLPEKWELRMVVPAKPNRLIIYPTSAFHSRYPLDPLPGRLVHTSFFS